MSCERCDQWLQELLDGIEPDALVMDHVAACPVCSELHESALGLLKGLSLLPSPEIPAALGGRIVSAVVFDRKRRSRRRQLLARVVALAAGVLVVLSVADSPPRQRQTNNPEPVSATQMSSPRQMAAEAGSAVADLTTRKVDEMVKSTSWLFPTVDASVLPPMDISSPLEPTAKPLSEASKGVTAGLEPVTGSARRALALFVRDLTPGNLMGKPGS
jgi:hypothetical protein